MAQRPVAQRLLARPAKTTSAGFLALVVVAALALSGCGGGSSDSSSSDSSASSGPGGPGSDTSSSASASADDPRAKTGSEAGGPSAGDAADPGGSGGQGEQRGEGSRQDPHIAQPKGEPEPGITPRQREEATVARMPLESPSSQSSGGGPRAL